MNWLHIQTNDSGFKILHALTEDIKKDENNEYWAKEWHETWKYDKESHEWQVSLEFE